MHNNKRNMVQVFESVDEIERDAALKTGRFIVLGSHPKEIIDDDFIPRTETWYTVGLLDRVHCPNADIHHSAWWELEDDDNPAPLLRFELKWCDGKSDEIVATCPNCGAIPFTRLKKSKHRVHP